MGQAAIGDFARSGVVRRLRPVALLTVAVVTALATVLATMLAAGRSQADTVPAPLTVSRPDIVGYPYVDLVLGGVPGLGIGKPPEVDVTQAGQTLRTTTSWDLSTEHPIGVVVDVPAASIASAQGLVAELVQELPPDVALSLTWESGAAGAPDLNRNTTMAALAHLRPGTPTTVHDGIAAASASGVQHIFVITTCGHPAPAATPGVIVDLLGIGAACTGAWPALATTGAGTFTASSNFTSGLAALDVTVARWRSSVVVIAEALTRDPLVLAVADDQVTAVLPAAAGASAITAGPSGSSASASSPSSGGGTTIVVAAGLLLILGIALVLALLALRRRRRSRPAATAATAATAAVPPGPTPPVRPARVQLMPVEEELVEPITAEPITVEPITVEPITVEPITVEPRPANGRPAVLAEPMASAVSEPLPHQREGARLDRPLALIDLREPAIEPADLEPTPTPTSTPAATPTLTPTDVTDVRDTAVVAVRETQMAVAVGQPNGKAERPQPAAVAELVSQSSQSSHSADRSNQSNQSRTVSTVSVEESVTVAEETPEQTEVAEPSETSEMIETNEGNDVSDVSDESDVNDASEVEVAAEPLVVDVTDAGTGEDVGGDAAENAVEDVADPEPIEDLLSRQPRSEFQWTKLEFTPLVWRYDQEPEGIDLRDDAAAETTGRTVDVRDPSVRKQPRRKRARR